MTDKCLIEIDNEIARSQSQIAALQAERKQILGLTPAQHLAIYLHRQIGFGKVNDDGWGYEDSWKNYAHSAYLDKAEKIIKSITCHNDGCSESDAYKLAVEIVSCL